MPLLGIELSCADKNHVVGIFDNQSKKIKNSKKNINNFLEKYLMDEKDGLYITSLEAIEEIFQRGGIAYIAHIKSSPMFSSDEKFLSGAYKTKLFSCSDFHIAGVGLNLITDTVLLKPSRLPYISFVIRDGNNLKAAFIRH